MPDFLLNNKSIEKEDAIIARLKAEKEYFGEFSANQDLFEKYNI